MSLSYSFLKQALEKKYKKEDIKNNTIERADAIKYIAMTIRNGRADKETMKSANRESVEFINAYLAEDKEKEGDS